MPKKILLLHGSRQTGQLLLGRLDRFRRRLLAELDLEFVAPDAPFEVSCLDSKGNIDGDSLQLTWWELHENDYRGLEVTLDRFKSPTWNDDEFVGIMGFSQGARLLHLILLLRQNQATTTLLPSLKFAILVSGYDAPLPENLPIDDPGRISLPSLHIFGQGDALILPEQSKALTEKYTRPQVYSHPGRHFVPVKKPDIDTYLGFIRASLIPSRQDKVGVMFCTTIDDETATLQADEVQSLLAMFPDEVTVVSEFNQSCNGDFHFQYPIRYQVKIEATDPDENSLWPIHPLTIQVSYPSAYPLEAVPDFDLIHRNTNVEFPSSRADKVLSILHETSQLELGMPSILSGIYGVKSFLDEPAMERDLHQIPTLTSAKLKQNIDDGHSRDSAGEIDSCIVASPPELIDARNREGLEIAERILKEEKSRWRVASSLRNSTRKSDGGSWNYVIGLIGKPSAGKSTFFNAATAFARGDGACMAAHPFTTIDPNTGYCFVPASNGACPEDETMQPSEYGSTHGRSPDGRRFLPVVLKDVAGLVPGAYQGKGKGNQFLNDLTDATVLIHVVDASGTSDPGGNKVAANGSLDDLSNPLDDLAWIRNELVEWIFSNLVSKWDGVQRRGRDRLAKLFSGYGQREAETQAILREVESYLDKTYQREHALRDLRNWNKADIHLLVSTFLGVRFPMALALNKCDIPSSRSYVETIQDSLPIAGAYHGTPMTADEEMRFVQRNSTKSIFSVGKETVYNLSPPVNVWACLTSALSIREPVLVFPVVDMVSYAPLPGLNRFAAEDPSLPSQSMICCIEASGGELPSCFDTKIRTYAAPNKETSSMQRLRDVVIMKPGSTVEDLFLNLKRRGALSGEFVRAEAACNIGDKPRPIPKFETITRNSRIIKIMSTKRTAWQGER